MNPSDDVPDAKTNLIGPGENRTYGTEHIAIGINHPGDSSSAETPTALTPADAHAIPTDISIRTVLTRPILMALGNYVCLTFLDMSNFTLLPLVDSTPIAYGGLGLRPFDIGLILGVFGIVNSVIQAKLLGRFIRKYGARGLYKKSICLLGCLATYPIMHFFAQRAGRVNLAVRACIFVQLSFQAMIYMAYGSIQILLIECVPEGGPMGTVNGVAQMLASGSRSFAPSFASSLFAVSLQRKLAGGNMVYYILIAMTLVGLRFTTSLPKTEKAKRRSGKLRSPSQSLSRVAA